MSSSISMRLRAPISVVLLFPDAAGRPGTIPTGPRANGSGARAGRAPLRGAARGCSGQRLETLGEASGVALLGARQGLEPVGDLLEPLVARRAGEARVHLGVLVGLALDGRLQVVGGGAHRDAGHRVPDLAEEVEVPEGVARLALSDGTKQGGDIGVALHVGLLGEVEVATVGLALARERLLEVRLGL